MPNALTLTDAMAEAIVNAVSRGVPLETAAVAAGLSAGAIYDWVNAGQTGQWSESRGPVSAASRPRLARFAEQIARARAQWEATRIERINAVADSDAKDAWRAGAWLANNHPATRERYHEHRSSSHEQTITVHQAHTMVRELPDAELLALPDASDSGSTQA